MCNGITLFFSEILFSFVKNEDINLIYCKNPLNIRSNTNWSGSAIPKKTIRGFFNLCTCDELINDFELSQLIGIIGENYL